MMKEFGRWILWCAGVVLLLAGIISCQSAQNSENNDLQVDVETDTIVAPPPVLKYGLPIDSFEIVAATVKPNQFLSNILGRFNVDLGTIDQIARKSRDVFDVRRIKSGNLYTMFLSPDSLQQPQYFVYENSATEYTVYELFDTLNIYQGEKPTESRLKTAQGVIESSLWNTMIDNNLDPMLALDLSDIFAWTIDFFAIQEGDRFRVIYDELFVDSLSIGIGTIYAVEFDHYGEANYAFRFYQDDRYDFFDEEGASLRKAFLKAPLSYTRISSRFSNSRMHPVLRIRRPHQGVDYAAPSGTPVLSIGDGTVIARAYQANGGGNYLKIKHNSVYTTTYMHLSGFANGITTGTRVQQGQVIGYVGATGLATGPHLDFRIAKNGTLVDPLQVEAPPVEPVKEENVDRYAELKDSLMNELQRIPWQDEMIALD